MIPPGPEEETSLIGSVLSTKKWKSPFKRHSHSSSRDSANELQQSTRYEQKDTVGSANTTSNTNRNTTTNTTGTNTVVNNSPSGNYAGAASHGTTEATGVAAGSTGAISSTGNYNSGTTGNAGTFDNSYSQTRSYGGNNPEVSNFQSAPQGNIARESYGGLSGAADTQPNNYGNATSTGTHSNIDQQSRTHESTRPGEIFDKGTETESKGHFFDPRDAQSSARQPIGDYETNKVSKSSHPTAIGAAQAAFHSSPEKTGFTKGPSAYVDDHQLKEDHYKKKHGHQPGYGAAYSASSSTHSNKLDPAYKAGVVDAAHDTGKIHGEVYKAGVADAAYSTGKQKGINSVENSSDYTSGFSDGAYNSGKEVGSYSTGVSDGAYDMGKQAGYSKTIGENDSRYATSSSNKFNKGTSENVENIRKEYDSELARIEAEIAETERELKNINLTKSPGTEAVGSGTNQAHGPFISSISGQSSSTQKAANVPLTAYGAGKSFASDEEYYDTSNTPSKTGEPYHVVNRSNIEGSDDQSKKGGFFSSIFGGTNTETSATEENLPTNIPGTSANAEEVSHVSQGIPGAFNMKYGESATSGKEYTSSKTATSAYDNEHERDFNDDTSSSTSHGLFAGVAAAAASVIGYGSNSDEKDLHSHGPEAVETTGSRVGGGDHHDGNLSDTYHSKPDPSEYSMRSNQNHLSKHSKTSEINTGIAGGKISGISDSNTRFNSPQLKDSLPTETHNTGENHGSHNSSNRNSGGFLATATGAIASAVGYGSSENDDISEGNSSLQSSSQSQQGWTSGKPHNRSKSGDHRSLIEIAENADPDVKEAGSHQGGKTIKESGSTETQQAPGVQVIPGLVTINARNVSDLENGATVNPVSSRSANDSNYSSYSNEPNSKHSNSTDAYKAGVTAGAFDKGKQKAVSKNSSSTGAGVSGANTEPLRSNKESFNSGVSAGAYDQGKQRALYDEGQKKGAKDAAYKSGARDGAYDTGKAKASRSTNSSAGVVGTATPESNDDYKTGVATAAYEQGKQKAVKDEAYKSGVSSAAYNQGRSKARTDLAESERQHERENKQYEAGFVAAAYDAGKKAGHGDAEKTVNAKKEAYKSGVIAGAHDQGKESALQDKQKSEAKEKTYASGVSAGAYDIGKEKGLHAKKKQLEDEAEALKKKQFEQARSYQSQHQYQSGVAAGAYDAGKEKGVHDKKHSKHDGQFEENYKAGFIAAAHDAGKAKGYSDRQRDTKTGGGSAEYTRGVHDGAYDSGRHAIATSKAESGVRGDNDFADNFEVTEITDGPLRQNADDIIVEVTGATNSAEAREAALRKAKQIQSQGIRGGDLSKIYVETVEHAKTPGGFAS